jgi:hypothetical protein
MRARGRHIDVRPNWKEQPPWIKVKNPDAPAASRIMEW